MKSNHFLLLCLGLTSLASGQVSNPTVVPNGVVNIASFVYAGLPNGDIAPGSMVVIFGTNFGPQTLQQSGAYPLPTSLGGSSVKVTSGSVTVDAIMIYTSATQMAAVIPSSLPPGAATLAVTFNGKTSLPAAFKIVPNSFGIFASNQGGSGPGIIANANSQVYGINNAVNPGETSVIWGTGLGAVAGNEAAGALPGDLPNLPVEVFVGGQKASVVYRGRSGCCSGIDQIAFVVPSVTGCRVPVAVKINNVVSNYISVPIAPAGTRTCSDPNGPSTADVQRFSVTGASTSQTVLTRVDTYTPVQFVGDSISREEFGTATFYKYSTAQLNTAQNPFNTAAIGGCFVSFYKLSQLFGEGDPVLPVSLDAGTGISVAGASGTKKMTLLKTNGPTHYYADLGIAVSGATAGYLEPGPFTVTGASGAGVGSFQAAINVPGILNWTNRSTTTTVTRSDGQLVTWTGGDPAGTVTVSGSSLTGGTANSVAAAFTCTVNVSDGQFTIPAAVLLSLPVSGTAASGVSYGSLQVTTNSRPVPVVATGLDAANALSSVTVKRPVNYR